MKGYSFTRPKRFRKNDPGDLVVFDRNRIYLFEPLTWRLMSAGVLKDGTGIWTETRNAIR